MTKSTKKIKIIGLGGIGTCLVPVLIRYLNYEYDDHEVHVTLIDGDSYEEKNRSRQHFSEYGNKAEVTVTNLVPQFPQIQFTAKKKYVNEDNVISLIREGDIVFACVDNHVTRKLISDRCEELDNVTLISGGNDHTDGNVILYRRVNGEDVGRAPTAIDPNIANPEDEHPSDLEERAGCQEEVEEFPQLLFANNQAAASMCNVLLALDRNKADFEQVYFDTITQKSRPVPEKNLFEEV